MEKKREEERLKQEKINEEFVNTLERLFEPEEKEKPKKKFLWW